MEDKKKNIIRIIVQTAISILSAIAAVFGVQSCK